VKENSCMYKEIYVGTHAHANTCTRTQSLYIIGNRIFISTSEFDGNFADYIKDTAVGCALVDQLTTKY
jgi:hypothetical protein